MLRGAQFRYRAGHRRIGIFQVGGRIGCTADFAGIAVLVFRTTFRALALNEAVGQKHQFNGIKILLYAARFNQAVGFQRQINLLGIFTRLRRMCGVIVIKANVKAGEIAGMFDIHTVNQLLRSDAFLFGTQHNRRAMRVVGAHQIALVAALLLKAHPDVGLYQLQHMAKVNCAVGIGQGIGDKNFALHEANFRYLATMSPEQQSEATF